MGDTGIASKVYDRARSLLPPPADIELSSEFIKDCLDNNERGDGVLFATLNKHRFLYNTTPNDGEWYRWSGHCWQLDDFREAVDAIESIAEKYLEQMASAEAKIKVLLASEDEDEQRVAKSLEKLVKKYESRIQRLRSSNGASKVLYWAPIVCREMACKESDFDRNPDLLPVRNGVIDLRTGKLLPGRQSDKFRRFVDIDYDPNADTIPVIEFVADITIDDNNKDTEELPAYIQKVFGYAATGHASEQYIFVFLGPGRNGKGVLFNIVSSILGPYYHEVSRAMILEQRNEPSPSAASEHKYALMGKRMVVGAETNKGQKIDAGAVKTLTGKNAILARPNFGKEVVFNPTHSFFLQTNNIPFGLTKEFSLVQRLVLINLPYMYVDDIAADERKFPAHKGKFRQKDKDLEDKLMQHRQGWLKWIVDGARLWYESENGLAPPKEIRRLVDDLAKEEDYIGRFIETCLRSIEPALGRELKDHRLSCKDMYNAFLWWFSENQDLQERKIPAVKTINNMLRERGYKIEPTGGVYYIHWVTLNFEIIAAVDDYLESKKGRKS